VALLVVGLCGEAGLSSAQTVDAAPAKVAVKRAKAAPAGETAGELAKKDPAAMQASIENAAKLNEAGKYEHSVATLSDVISRGNLPPASMARALYLRGAAYLKLQKPALSISDLTSALWLKGGLGDTDKAEATRLRATAYAEAGLNEQGQALAAGTAATRSKTAATAHAPANEASAASSSNGGGGFLQGLFGGGGGSSGIAAEDPPTTRTSRNEAYGRANVPSKDAPPVVPQAASGTAPAPAGTTVTENHSKLTIAAATAPTTTAAAAKVAKAPQQGPAKSAAVHTGGAFQARVALAKTMPEAEAVVAKLRAQFHEALGDRTPAISQTSFGNMGTYYQVRVGPFASTAEAGALCGRLKGSGLDCVAVNTP
jgi:hypothetical protein